MLDKIAQAISNAYAGTDIALYTVAIPQQDFSSGEVRVRVIEGYVEHVFLSGPASKGDQDLVKQYAAHLTRERPLRRSTLERYLSLIRDIPGLKVDPQLVLGSQSGAVRLMLDLKRKPVEVGLSIDDRGVAYLGRTQMTLEADFNGMIRQGDQTKLVFATPTDFEQFHYYSISHSEPIGSNGLTVLGQFGYLETKPTDSPIRGRVIMGSAQVSYPLIRSYGQNLYVAGEIDALDSDNGAFGALISSEHTRVARANLSYTKAKAKRTLQVAVSLSQGVDGLGAKVDPRLGSASFTKFTAQAAMDQRLTKTVVLRVRAASQLAGEALPASEAFSLGGDQFGRAFPAAYVLGDSGAAGSGELAWSPTLPWSQVAGSEVYGFVDGGVDDERSRILIPTNQYTLASAGVGVRISVAHKMVFDIEGAKAVKSPFPNTGDPWRLVLGWRGTY